ncbi:Protein CBG19644 [Caenorhabditis briggsae]|uniref:Protein CBG19644 n=1 Tax=Caenorhabditis briggsae TaxID=6238 RepID=A8XW34_CAEBR|nr:Protein CBG19644 [Caenorhabditis briggsae]CAP36853.2 Protein CBG19644 [Caenorhabditis briggsae]
MPKKTLFSKIQSLKTEITDVNCKLEKSIPNHIGNEELAVFQNFSENRSKKQKSHKKLVKKLTDELEESQKWREIQQFKIDSLQKEIEEIKDTRISEINNVQIARISFKMSKNDNTADPGENSQDGSVAKKPENLPEIDKIKQTLKRKLDEITEKVQSLEESISKIPKIENDEKSTDRTDNKADSSKNSSSSNGSTVPKAIQKSEKRFVLKHVSKDVENLVEGKSYTCDMENHFSVDRYI